MKVNIKDDDKTTTGEMVGASGEVGSLVGEMLSEPAKLSTFGFGDDVIQRANSIKEALEDDKPMIAVVRVEEGWSGSGRLWPEREIRRIVAQTNELEPVGHLGHIPDQDAATSMPEPQTTWIGAIAKTEASKQKGRVGEQVCVAYFAGYNHPGAKIRGIIKARAVRGISWWGRAAHKPIPGKGVEMVDFDLQALDWARKGAEGMPTSSVVAIAKEMNGGNVAELDLAQVTPEQFKKDNPNGYALLVREVTDEQKATIGEMEEKVKAGDEAQSKIAKACELLGIDDPDKLVEKITALKKRVGDRAKLSVESGVMALLKEKIPGDDEDEDVKNRRQLLYRLLPVAEMESKVADLSEDDAEGAKKLIGEMVDKSFDTDTQIKTLIGEQQPVSVRRREQLGGGAGQGGNNDYIGERQPVQV